ncbi:D-aminoacylase [Acidaminobacter sp. JC074]|uniref:N-acyl-D-amino-acid deacylase family protein n=1 Tax=Acidaminobacter sp. JC074 TaxID=2530199 RepID=UPI001F0DFC82|nr:amidohydrolase family protein [Acidaminobacter sp. JC074]MCH4887466.1 D-aminoacylase [Acidaminobacter sp. JC074]
MFDLVIKNGEVITDNQVHYLDIGIKDGMIRAMKPDLDGEKVIDAGGLVVSPGFIDMHTHSDVSFIMHPTNDSKLYQGVTTEVTGCCGFSYFPYTQKGMALQEKNNDLTEYDSRSIDDFAKKFSRDMSLNWAGLVGHGPLRLSVVGDLDLEATDDQIDQMKALLHEELKAGAFGLSLGVAYAPGMFANTKEFIELAKVVKKYDKIVSSHIRNENVDVFESVEELIEIGRKSSAHVHISHLKLGYGSWHRADELLKLIDDASKEGVHITFEQYPYIASATGLSAVLPNWVHDGGTEKMMYRFKYERERVIKGIESDNSYKMGLDRVVVVTTRGFFDQGDGKSIREISGLLNKSEAETVIYLLENLNCDVPTIRFTMTEEDVFKIASRPDCAVISDGSAYSLDKSLVKGMPHPRSFGTFPRYLSLNRKHGWMRLDQALYKMTGLPADLMGLKKRGSIKVGYHADITIFDKDKITDQARYDDSIQAPLGISYVIVGGKLALENGQVRESAGEMLLSL